jgi:hypothetical protein
VPLANLDLRTALISRWRPRLAVDAVLAGWFLLVSFAILFGAPLGGRTVGFGWDAVVYTHAGRALLSGGDPWSTSLYGITFAAPPPSLLPYLPLVWLPDPLVAGVSVAAAAGCAWYAIRALKLPVWWLAFPPIVLGVAAGSSALLVLALLIRGGVIADSVAVLSRVYASVPLMVLGRERWRGLVVAGAAVVVTLPFLGWSQFIAAWPEISGTLALQANGGLSATVSPVHLVIAVVALIALGRRRAAWLLVPALWPNTQLYYATIALPVLAELPLVALAIASPASPGLIAFGMAAQVIVDRAVRRFAPGLIGAPMPVPVPVPVAGSAQFEEAAPPAPQGAPAPRPSARRG